MKLRSSRRASYMPDDMIVQIIRRLPVKNILRFRCVNKSWYNFIGTSAFIKSSILNKKNNDTYLLGTHLNYYTLTNVSEGYNDPYAQKYYYSPQLFGINDDDYSSGHKVKVYGICNGLLCVSDLNLHITSRIFLWNPVIRKAKEISMIRAACGEVRQLSGHDVDLCFGYFHDDYKVIRISPFRGGIYRVGVYSLSTDAWKVMYCGTGSDSRTHFLVCNPASTKFVGGVAYFAVAHSVKFSCKLVCFDLEHERIREEQFPDKFNSQLDLNSRNQLDPFSVECIGESLGLIQIRQGHLTRWELRKCAVTSSWTWDNIVTVKLATAQYLHPLGMTRHGKYLLRDNVEGQYLWDLGISRLEECESHMGSEDLWASAIDSLLGNLVLLDEETIDPSGEFEPCSDQTTCVLYRMPSPNKKRLNRYRRTH